MHLFWYCSHVPLNVFWMQESMHAIFGDKFVQLLTCYTETSKRVLHNPSLDTVFRKRGWGVGALLLSGGQTFVAAPLPEVCIVPDF